MISEAERRARAVQLRRNGATYQQIADAITVEYRLPATAYNALHARCDIADAVSAVGRA